MDGDTKVSIGNKKTIFVKSNVNIDKMKMPFLVQYNKKIIVQDRRWTDSMWTTHKMTGFVKQVVI